MYSVFPRSSLGVRTAEKLGVLGERLHFLNGFKEFPDIWWWIEDITWPPALKGEVQLQCFLFVQYLLNADM